MPAYNRIVTDLHLTVKQLRQESRSCFTVVLERPAKFTYNPGDWIDFGFERSPETVVKTFSLSSSPTEPDLMVTFKQGVSEFKRRLQNVAAGDILYVTQYGNSGFDLDKRYTTTLMAGGVGVAPFRSMIQELIDTQSRVDVTLIYQSRDDDFPFRDEINQWATVYPSLRVHYLDSTLKGRVKKDAILKLAPLRAKSMYYIVGPPGMVKTTEEFLIEAGVSVKDIADDSFAGY